MSTAALESEIEALRVQIESIHDSLESRSINSRRAGSLLTGEVFSVPVDAEHKAKQLPILNCSNPHMRAFHASWFGFFATFFSTFAPAPLAGELLRPKSEGGLGITRPEIGLGNLMSVTSNIICRVLMGLVCDKIGARRGLAFILLITCPGILGIMFVDNAEGFIACRFIIGMGLASFVACQVWCTQQFSKSVVGVANATSGGWGNLGGGMTNLLIPFIFDAFYAGTGSIDLSWRLCFLVPLTLHIVGAIFALTGRDLPDGNYAELEAQGSKQKSKGGVVLKVGLSNVNAWILTLSYGFCFGVELTVTNVASLYFHEFFALPTATSGVLASIFGLVNIFARSLGGICSDWASRKWGMRGRIWMLWFWQMVEGVICMAIGLVTVNMAAPDINGAADVTGWAQLGGWARPSSTGWVRVSNTPTEWVPFNGTGITQGIVHCGVKQVDLTSMTAEQRSALDPRFASYSSVVLSEPPSPWGAGDPCVSNSGQLPTVIILFFLFSLAVQMAEGLTYGVVPFVSRPALGVVSGMVGAGGNAGSMITLAAFFRGTGRDDVGLINMGITILAVTMLLIFVHFPEHGSMFFKKGAISYDPQFIKPPAGYRGADDLQAVAPQEVKVVAESNAA